MRYYKIALVGSTALTLSMTVAFADNNEAYLQQDGTNNLALIEQSGADESSVGHVKPTPSGPGGIVDGIAKQVGDDNVMNITQTGSANRVAPGPFNDGRADQLGDGNTLTILQSRTLGTGGFGNSVGTTIQNGDNHSASITQTALNRGNVANLRQRNEGDGEDGNTASITQNNTGTGNERNFVQTSTTDGGVTQNGERNEATVNQDGLALRLRRLDQIGDDNEAVVVMSGERNGVAPYDLTADFSGASDALPSQVLQFGDWNQTNLNIGGADNSFGVLQDGNYNDALGIMVTGNDNSIGVGQYGDNNVIALATITGDENSVGFYQFGNDNFGSAMVDRNENNGLISQIGDRNVAYLEVFGTRNEATLSVTGNDNYLNAYQRGRAHTMTVNFDGNGNNNSALAVPLSGAALTAVNLVQASGKLRSANFGAGDLIQLDQSSDNRQRNSLTITGTLADNSSFAMYQNGSENSITGSISNGSNNQAVVAQIGNDNAATFSQTGSNNNAGIIQ